MSDLTLKAQYNGSIEILTKEKRGTIMKICLPQ